jgi:hypothetical protein
MALNEDIDRFIRDRDRTLRIELSAVGNDMAFRGLFYSSVHLGALTTAKRSALHDYREEVTRKRRRYADVSAAERFPARLLRRRRGKLGPFALTDEARATLATWREDATIEGLNAAPVDDPTSEEREPAIRRFESEGDTCE